MIGHSPVQCQLETFMHHLSYFFTLTACSLIEFATMLQKMIQKCILKKCQKYVGGNLVASPLLSSPPDRQAKVFKPFSVP